MSAVPFTDAELAVMLAKVERERYYGQDAPNTQTERLLATIVALRPELTPEPYRPKEG